jgi:hypothetical protein
MKTKTYQVYKFSELSEESQEKAINNLYDINVDHQWWEFIYEDAKNIGLNIEGFDIDRGSYCKGSWNTSPYECIKLIKKEHGKKCETYKTAVSYEKQFKALGKDEDGNQIEDENLEDDFRNSLLEDHRIMLSKEYEYLTRKEAIIETIEANDYDFTANGEID